MYKRLARRRAVRVCLTVGRKGKEGGRHLQKAGLKAGLYKGNTLSVLGQGCRFGKKGRL